MICTSLTDDELREIGWSEDQISIGLIADVLAFFFIKNEGDMYGVERSLRGASCDIDLNVTFRGERWTALITTWI